MYFVIMLKCGKASKYYNELVLEKNEKLYKECFCNGIFIINSRSELVRNPSEILGKRQHCIS